ncbi:MAG: hypothetical protein JXB38_08380 [Anaerolineales bacterium]|nr:hypothetical protein [Anaerolineales bacterium]
MIPTITATVAPTATILPSATLTLTVVPTFTETAIPSLTFTPTITPYPQPEGCLQPPDDYTRVEVNGHTLSARTYFMLQHAAELYGGEIDVAGVAITQGSYVDAEPLSFGTHSGGGAVDLSVIARDRWEVLYDEISPLLEALRTAGFAAWLREYGELSEGSPIHIHAIAIGDAELSQTAQAQLTGEYGYFRGYNGLPPEYGGPALDRYGGPVVCKWMLDMGYADWRTSSP